MSQQELLRKLEQRLTSEYKDTEAVIRAKIAYFTEDFDKDNKLHQKMVKDGVMSRQEYKRWYKDQMFAQKWANKMTTVISEDLTNANVTASKIINNNASAMFIDGATEAVKELQDYDPFEVFDTRQIKSIANENAKHLPESRVKIPKDQKWNEKRIKSSLMQSAVKGESAQQLAGRLLTVVGMNRKSAIRNARTMMTGSHNMGKLELGNEALEMGLDVRKKWIATFDNRTRNSHASMHEEVVDMDEEFSNGLMFPADPDGDPAEVYNCRCTMVITHDPKRGGMSKEEFEENVAENEQRKAEFRQANQDLKNGGRQSDTSIAEAPSKPIKEGNPKDLEKPNKNDEPVIEKLQDGIPNEATEWYVSGEGMWINQYLRGREGIGELNEFEKDMLSKLDKATNGTIKDNILYRSVDASAIFGNISQSQYDDLRQYVLYGEKSFGKGAYADGIRARTESIINNALDKQFIEKGFMSTTADKDVAEGFGGFTGSDKPVVMRIVNAKGAKGVDVSIYDKNTDDPQFERLLARNQNYVTKTVYSENGEIYIDIELIKAKKRK